MQAPDTTNDLREALAGVVQKHDEASGEYTLLHADWHAAAAKGEDAKADKLEIEIEKVRRLMQRLALRRASLEQEIGNAEEVARARHAAKLKTMADAILTRAGQRVADMEPIAVTLAKAVDELEGDFSAWREARYYAQQAGAAPEGFATQENEARVSRIVESLGFSKIRTANISKELSRISVFQ